MKSYLTADLNNQAVPSAPKWFALLIIVLRVVCLVHLFLKQLRILVDQTDTLIPIVGNTDIALQQIVALFFSNSFNLFCMFRIS